MDYSNFNNLSDEVEKKLIEQDKDKKALIAKGEEREKIEEDKAKEAKEEERLLANPFYNQSIFFGDLEIHGKYLIQNLIPKNSIGMLYAESGTGKTYLALDWALSIASGRDKWLDYKINSKDFGTIFYINTEGKTTIEPRINAWCIIHEASKEEKIRINENLVITNFKPINSLGNIEVDKHRYYFGRENATQEAEENLITDIKESGRYKPSKNNLIIVDTLRNILDGDENKSDQITRLLNSFYKISDKLNATILFIHHTGKTDPKKAKDEAYRGSSALYANIDFVFSLEFSGNKDKHLLTLNNYKQKGDETTKAINLTLAPPVKIGIDTDNNSLLTDRAIIKSPELSEEELEKKLEEKNKILPKVINILLFMYYAHEKKAINEFGQLAPNINKELFNPKEVKKFIENIKDYKFLDNDKECELYTDKTNINKYIYKLIELKYIKKDEKDNFKITPTFKNKYKSEYKGFKIINKLEEVKENTPTEITDQEEQELEQE